jgi:DNA-binding NarL/FixJ family response regulator
MVTALQTMVTRRFDVFDPVVITVGSFHAGTARNVIPDEARFEATARSYSPAARRRQARRHLSAARDIFGQLGAAPWAARASSELRATGQPDIPDQCPAPVTLTPQQRQIATLAAAGLTNKQIGERLYLSHRTIATHLHQIFPKLGVTARAALRDALSGDKDSDRDLEEADRQR